MTLFDGLAGNTYRIEHICGTVRLRLSEMGFNPGCNITIINNINSNLTPGTNNQYNLGSNSNKFKQLFVGSNGISVGTSTITDVSGILTTNDLNVVSNIVSNSLSTKKN